MNATEEHFYRQIAASTAHRPVRDRLCGEVLADPALFAIVMEMALNCENEHHHKACWTLELILESNIRWLTTHCDSFTAVLGDYKHEGALRSISKICMFAALQHEKENYGFLSDAQLNSIITSCFDWLIGDAKVATKAYAMRTLYCMGKGQPWIHDELKHILTQGFPNHSPGYKAAAKDILKRIG